MCFGLGCSLPAVPMGQEAARRGQGDKLSVHVEHTGWVMAGDIASSLHFHWWSVSTTGITTQPTPWDGTGTGTTTL